VDIKNRNILFLFYRLLTSKKVDSDRFRRRFVSNTGYEKTREMKLHPVKLRIFESIVFVNDIENQ